LLYGGNSVSCSALQRHSGQVLVVERHLAGIRLADLLAQAMPNAHSVDLRRLLAGGAVRVNGEPCLVDRRLRSSDVVQVAAEIAPPRPAPRGPAVAPEVLWESAHALVLHKPPGLPTVPDRQGRQRGVHGLLPALRPDADLRIVHRLDRDTSGCLIVAKGLAAAQHFDRCFRDGTVHKTYRALVHGVPTAAAFAIRAWLGPDRKRPGKVVAAASEQPGFRAAHTEVVCEQAFASHALLRLSPTTGRSHQLRVHLQSVGHPIVADRDYGGEPLLLSDLKPGYKLRRGVDERPLTPRMFLHSARVVCSDVDGAAIDVTAPLPEDLAVALRQLESFADRRRRHATEDDS
jgi:RluA family pseudouridine synthase